jgi:hypothetical protein
MIMTAVESLLALVGQRKREREQSFNDNEEKKKKKKRKKMPANDEMYESANTYIRPVRQQIILQ